MAKNRFHFSRLRLHDLPLPRKGWVYFYDDAVRGLAIGVSVTGAKSFRACKKFRGMTRRVTLGTFDPEMPETRELPAGAHPLDLLGNHPALNVRMARKLATAVLAQLDTGVNPAEVAQARRGMNAGELFRRYRSYLAAEGRKTVDALTWTWERYLGQLPDVPKKPHGAERTKAPGAVNWERRPIAEITHEQVSRLRLDLGEKVGRTTANRVMELLRAMFNFAKKQRLYTGENPAEGNGKFKLASRERFLQPDEAKAFFKALDDEPDQEFADYVRISLYTGARRGNVLPMKWENLNLDGARWSVSGEMMKNGEPLTIPLVQEAVDLLRRRGENANGSPWVFPGGSAAGHMGAQRKKWIQLVKSAGSPDLRVHTSVDL